MLRRSEVLRFATVVALTSTAGGMAPAAAQHQHTTQAAAGSAGRAPLFDNLGNYHREIKTKPPEAQKYFDQGLRLMYAFNLDEAQRSFEEVTKLDPDCAMGWWGVAMSLGPHINLPALPDRTKAAKQAVLKAVALQSSLNDVERALIEALDKRYADPPPEKPEAQKAMDQAYADAMKAVYARFPNDEDVAAFYVEAMMDLRPWDLWTKDGQPQPGTVEIVSTLETMLKRDPNHPGANHYYIHAVEASPHPEKAKAAADRVAKLMPGAAHMVHMPSHIYQRMGRYEQAAQANREAILSDKAYLERAKPQGFYLMYVAHNYQFLMNSSMSQGRSAEALENARLAGQQMPLEMLKQMPGFDFVLGYPQWVQVRFARWDEVLKEPAPPSGFPYAKAVWHCARGLAFVGTKDLAAAAREQDSLLAIAKTIPAEAPQGLNTSKQLLDIATNVLGGRIASGQGNYDEAVQRLQAAVRVEDDLRYNEPPDWYYPVRHELGAVLLEAGRASAAQEVFKADLKRNPENGWALHGLVEALQIEGKKGEAARLQDRFEKSWQRADYQMVTTRQ